MGERLNSPEWSGGKRNVAKENGESLDCGCSFSTRTMVREADLSEKIVDFIGQNLCLFDTSNHQIGLLVFFKNNLISVEIFVVFIENFTTTTINYGNREGFSV